MRPGEKTWQKQQENSIKISRSPLFRISASLLLNVSIFHLYGIDIIVDHKRKTALPVCTQASGQ